MTGCLFSSDFHRKPSHSQYVVPGVLVFLLFSVNEAPRENRNVNGKLMGNGDPLSLVLVAILLHNSVPNVLAWRVPVDPV